MRISDWSSDVCSSDLPNQAHWNSRAQVKPPAPHGKVAHFGLGRSIFCRSGHEHKKYFVLPLSLAYRAARCANRQIGRASCKGKSVSVRVDLGGRRIIKKKKNKKTTMNNVQVNK